MDRFAEKYSHLSSYQYAANNPIGNIDVNGDSISATFDRESNTLYVVDYDHYKEGLPFFIATPESYEIDGIYNSDGSLAVNQVLKLEGVFTGGESSEGGITYGATENQLAIPEGAYEILGYESSNENHQGWYRVDPIDSKPRNDKLDNPNYENSDGNMRSNFRLHPGTESWGCITFNGWSNEAYKGWKVLSNVLNKTSTREVGDKMGFMNSTGLRNTKVTRYGQITVH